jgi:hypothetical protein
MGAQIQQGAHLSFGGQSEVLTDGLREQQRLSVGSVSMKYVFWRMVLCYGGRSV